MIKHEKSTKGIVQSAFSSGLKEKAARASQNPTSALKFPLFRHWNELSLD
jgi:hypothetical protein